MSLGRPLFLVLLAGAVVMTVGRGAVPDSPSARFERREQARIRAHFDSVLGEMRSRDVSALSPVQQERRARLISVLEAYRDRGAFPHNYDVPDRAVPAFVDTKTGVRCAVGHLLDATGRGDVVARVASANLNVYAMELGTDTAFTGWLDAQGLTLSEAARIQPSYEPIEIYPYYPRNESTLLFAVSAGTLGLVNMVSNPTGTNRALSYIGLGVGAISLVAGIQAADERTAKTSVTRAAIGTGAASIVISTFTLMPRRTQASTGRSVTLAPALKVTRDRPQLGFEGRLRF